MPPLTNISSYQFLLNLLEVTNHEQSSQNNQSTWYLPLKYEGKWKFFFMGDGKGQTLPGKFVKGGYSTWGDKRLGLCQVGCTPFPALCQFLEESCWERAV